eukprot:TRINITY_DN91905_c0_g1_i1.p1 TRINITY_DN91905_c0_g1~~TRINITY_DN91905_c0_g1_i1.p1  ORF type:complete len:618 (+),score=146.40 TRINITY_DN91905_c0_g1_i1:97-1950(+)
MAAGGAAGANGLPMPREKLVPVIVNLLVQRGETAVNEIEKRIAAKQGFQIKGVQVAADLLEEALVLYRKKNDTPSLDAAKAVAAPRSAAAPPTGAASKWVPPEVSASAKASITVAELDDAKPYCATVKVVGENKVAILTKPDVLSTATANHVAAGAEVEVVAKLAPPKDGRVYLRLKSPATPGWICTRSRKDFSKIVIRPLDWQASIEPEETASLVDGLLAAVDEYGIRSDGGSGAALPAWFKATSRGHILSSPSVASASTAAAVTLASGDEFVAEGVYMNPSDGRAYLRLQNGRGWISERMRTNFFKSQVQAIMGPTAKSSVAPPSASLSRSSSDVGQSQSLPATKAWKTALSNLEAPKAAPSMSVGSVGSRKPIVVNRKDEDLPKPVVKSREPALAKGPILYRSDVDMWPEELRPPRPIERSVRTKLRRVYDEFGKRVAEAEKDLKEVQERVDGYARACPAQKEMLQYAETIRKELAKASKDWVQAAKKMLGSEGVDLDTPYTGRVPSAAPSTAARVKPAQVNGDRWYCAMIRAGSSDFDAPAKKADADSPDSPEKAGAALKHFGPLRQRASDATLDLQRMKRQLSSSDLSKVSSGDVPAAAPAKKARMVNVNID